MLSASRSGFSLLVVSKGSKLKLQDKSIMGVLSGHSSGDGSSVAYLGEIEHKQEGLIKAVASKPSSCGCSSMA